MPPDMTDEAFNKMYYEVKDRLRDAVDEGMRTMRQNGMEEHEARHEVYSILKDIIDERL